MKAMLIMFALLASSPLFAVCTASGSDPYGLNRPPEWQQQITAVFSDNSVAFITRDICRGDPSLNDGGTLMWWEDQFIGCSDNSCQAAMWPEPEMFYTWLPPDLRIWPRQRVG